jgi:tight adherence protein C
MNGFSAFLDFPGARDTLLVAVIVFVGALLLLIPMMSVRGRSRLYDEPSEPSGGLLGPRLAPPPPVSKLGAELKQAGYYHADAVARFNTLRVFLIMTALFMSGIFAAVGGPLFFTPIAIGGAVAAVLCFSVPRIYINLQARARVRAIEKALPVFADLMSLALLSGQNLLGALVRVQNEMRFSHPVFTQELDLVARHAEINNFTAAVEQFSERVNMPDVNNLSLILNQSQQMGTDIAAALMEFATVMRSTLKHRAETQAQRAGFWMMLVSLFFMWLPAAAILLTPAFFEFRERREKNREMMLQGKENYSKRFAPYTKGGQLPKSAPTTPAP